MFVDRRGRADWRVREAGGLATRNLNPAYTWGMPVTKRAVAGKLPAETTSFVGRRRLLAEIKSAFATSRLLTLVGPGGVGKTRLALRAAADLQRTARDGAWFVELAGLDDPHLVAKAFMTSLGMVDRSGQWPTSLLVTYLASRETLVVIDNCEHLLDAVAVLADVLLREAPGLRLLATSRQPIGISGERVVQVPSLSLQSTKHGRPGPGIAQSEALALLLERAAESGFALELTDDNYQLVIDLCRRLDGMPLALELAAVRLRTIGLRELVERMDDRFAVLTGGSRAAPPRQQTLLATVDWSHALLAAPETVVLRRLAVFPSDFGLDAAEAVATGPGVARSEVLDALAGLVEKSFVARLGSNGSVRYRLHETMREYALRKMCEAQEEEATIAMFVGFYAQRCRAAGDAAQTRDAVRWLQWLDDETDNIRAVLARCLRRPDRDMGMAIVGTLGWYWAPRATSEGMYWLDLYLEHRDGNPSALAHALFARSYVAVVIDIMGAKDLLADAEAGARAINDDGLLIRVLALAARVRAHSGDLDGARSQVGEAKTLAQRLNDPGADAALIEAQGSIALADGDLEAASRVYLESVAVTRDRGDLHTLLYSIGYYVFSLLEHSRSDEAGPLLEEGLVIAQRLDNRDVLVCHLYGLGIRDAFLGQHRRAARLLGAAAALQADMGCRLIPTIERLVARASSAIADSLEPFLLEAAMREGREMTRNEAVAYALRQTAPRQVDQKGQPTALALSKRQMEIATHVSEGLSNKEIALRCFLSERTVETHISHILDKLGINSRVEVARWVAQELRPNDPGAVPAASLPP